MLRWLTELHATSKRVVSYFVPREEGLSRVGQVMQTGQALYLACHEKLIDGQALCDALGVSTLSALDDMSYLILDDCDILDSQTLIVLIRTLLQNTLRLKLVLFSRRPLIDLHADSVISSLYACILGSSLIESPYEEERLVLYVESFGQGRVFVNGQLIEEWPGSQSIETFFVMLDLMPASIDTLLMALFGSTKADVYNKFHVSKSYINRALGQDFTMLGGGAQAREQMYYLSDKISLHSDFYDFGGLIKPMFDQNATSDTILVCATALMQFAYREYVGQVTDNAHLQGRRQQLAYYLSQALVQVGYRVWRRGDDIQAEALFARSSVTDRANREPVDALMALYRQQGRNQDAAAVYRRWKDAQARMAV